jgi:hypothetical protein
VIRFLLYSSSYKGRITRESRLLSRTNYRNNINGTIMSSDVVMFLGFVGALGVFFCRCALGAFFQRSLCNSSTKPLSKALSPSLSRKLSTFRNDARRGDPQSRRTLRPRRVTLHKSLQSTIRVRRLCCQLFPDMQTFSRAPAAAQVACTGGPCAAGKDCSCSALSNSSEACGYIASMNGNCSGCHNCPGSGWIMGTGITCSATCSSADTVWEACGNPGMRLPAPPAGSVTKTACTSSTGVTAPAAGATASRPGICKDGVAFTKATSADGVSADLLSRASRECDTRTVPACAELNAGAKKASFYEHTTYGAICCGARSNVRCLDNSSVCKDGFSKPFYADPRWEGKNCAFWDGFLLSMFDGTRVNWADITCEEIAAAKYDNSKMNLSVDTMSDALALGADCCGGPANLKCSGLSSFGHRRYGYNVWPLALTVLGVLQISATFL